MSDMEWNDEIPMTTKDMVDIYLQPAKEQIEQKRAKWSAWLNEAIMGERVASAEVKPGIWEHTFTPHTYTSTQTADSITADSLLKIAEGIKDQRTQQWLEEYERYSLASLLKEMEEMYKPLYDTPHLRSALLYPPIVIPPVGLRPLLAEGTPIRKWRRKVNARNRVRRQHRAAFRRRKRGLA